MMYAPVILPEKGPKQTVHKSTTHEELFFHVREPYLRYEAATVFFRKEDDGNWYASVARCSSEDQFSRRLGRSIARKAYFTNVMRRWKTELSAKRPTYDLAKELYTSGKI